MPSQDEYYAEDVFAPSVAQQNKVYTGPILLAWAGMMLGCFGMSAACGKSPNLAFRWLQRRVGFQFGAFSYFFTCNALYQYDAVQKRWVMRDWHNVARRSFGRMLWDLEKAQKRRTERLAVNDDAARAAAAAAPAPSQP